MERPQNAPEEWARCHSKALQRAGGLDLNYNRASVLCLAPKPPRGSFDVCAFSQLGYLLANCVVGGREAQSWQGIG